MKRDTGRKAQTGNIAAAKARRGSARRSAAPRLAKR
jgi:hypothetical protein